MKVKTSITLSKAALRVADRLAGKGASRSQVIEAAILEFGARRERALRDARDRQTIDRHADALNREALDVLDYQTDI
jgi:metal-responsive CopG/Arc/MetJ family transcriptional regulator